ncbi:MAG: translation initiation factor IF-3 [Planctomycetota bacterium]
MKKTRVNHEIRLSPIRLIDHENNQVGVVDTRDAMQMADEVGLDLVEIQPDVRPPVCKIMDYGKYKYELSKKEQRSRANSKQAELKEVRLGRSTKIGDHDVEIRVNQARRFLMDGHKVQFVQRFRGREMAHRDIGTDRLKGIVDNLADIAKVEVPPKFAGRQVTMILAPDKPRIEQIKAKQKREAEATATAAAAAAETEPAPVEQPAEAPVETAEKSEG